MRNHYDVLGVPPTATTDEIRQAWRTRVQRSHPDRHHGGDEAAIDAAERGTVLLNDAWAVLRDPERRAEYDRTLAREIEAFDPSRRRRRRITTSQRRSITAIAAVGACALIILAGNRAFGSPAPGEGVSGTVPPASGVPEAGGVGAAPVVTVTTSGPSTAGDLAACETESATFEQAGLSAKSAQTQRPAATIGDFLTGVTLARSGTVETATGTYWIATYASSASSPSSTVTFTANPAREIPAGCSEPLPIDVVPTTIVGPPGSSSGVDCPSTTVAATSPIDPGRPGARLPALGGGCPSR